MASPYLGQQLTITTLKGKVVVMRKARRRYSIILYKQGKVVETRKASIAYEAQREALEMADDTLLLYRGERP